jgi:hypothetical protein
MGKRQKLPDLPAEKLDGISALGAFLRAYRLSQNQFRDLLYRKTGLLVSPGYVQRLIKGEVDPNETFLKAFRIIISQSAIPIHIASLETSIGEL